MSERKKLILKLVMIAMMIAVILLFGDHNYGFQYEF